ncbi:Mov34/MPN/PAD-1 family protein [Salmonirosea aquatica]|uniref:MPN domain-containing protein n=1 Tax=Salmonirosea aquatica TaxID=2654236 RepID=A0A7C9FG74_9BACT|nr:hypothetical protein [Cytophagaceae bacterium SJW1-29]
MEKFSDKLQELTRLGEEGLPENLRKNLALLRKVHADGRFKTYTYSADTIALSFELTVNRPNRDRDFLNREPVLITIDPRDFPSRCPKAYSDRLDFPADRTPHVNPVKQGHPFSLCLFRGDSDSWFAQHTLSDFIERLRGWYEDAACGNLNHPDDEFEFMRLDNPEGIILFPEADALEVIKSRWANQNGHAGRIPCAFSTSDARLTADFQSLPMPVLWLFDFHNKPAAQERKILPPTDAEELGIEGYVFFPDKDTVDTRYVVNLPTTVNALVKWAGERGLVIEEFMNKTSGRIRKKQLVLPLIFAIRRPRKVLNHLGDMEFLAFFIELQPVEGGMGFDGGSCVRSMALIQKNTPQLARKLSARPLPGRGSDRIHFVGLGALGSKLALHQIRAGSIPASLIDHDLLLPHNNVRNALTGQGHLKVHGIMGAITLIYAGNPSILETIGCHPHTLLDVLNQENDLLADRDSLVLDSTASYAVEKLLDERLTPNCARYARVEITHRGRLSILRVEGSGRNPGMGDLMAEAYDLALGDGLLSEWLRDSRNGRESPPLGEEVYLGLGCSSDTLELSDDKVSLHASAASVTLGKITGGAMEQGLLHISYLDENSDWFFKSLLREIKPFEVIKAENNPGWQVRFKGGLYEQLIRELVEFRPSETGGILIGRMDRIHKTVYVTRILMAPADSIRSASRFVRGTDGLTEAVDEVRDKSGALLDYVGEWHTHPSGGTRLSEIDKLAISEIRATLDPLCYPTVVAIVTERKIAPYIFTKYEVVP